MVLLLVIILFCTPIYANSTPDIKASDTNKTILDPIQAVYNDTNQTSTINNLVTQLIAIQLILTKIDQTIPKNISVNNNSTVNTTEPDANQVQAKFEEIQKIPYNERTMNCKDKSELFADYLSKNGGKQISLVVIDHDSGNYSHEFVEWNNHYYDPCYDGISYNLSKTEYINKLHNLGFNGMIITSPYSP